MRVKTISRAPVSITLLESVCQHPELVVHCAQAIAVTAGLPDVSSLITPDIPRRAYGLRCDCEVIGCNNSDRACSALALSPRAAGQQAVLLDRVRI